MLTHPYYLLFYLLVILLTVLSSWLITHKLLRKSIAYGVLEDEEDMVRILTLLEEQLNKTSDPEEKQTISSLIHRLSLTPTGRRVQADLRMVEKKSNVELLERPHLRDKEDNDNLATNESAELEDKDAELEDKDAKNKKAELETGITFKEGITYKRVSPNQVVYVSSDGHYKDIVTTTDRIRVRKTLKELMESLDEDIFIRISKSHIINIKYVNGYNAGSVELKWTNEKLDHKKRLWLGEAYKHKFLRTMDNY